MIEIVEPKLRNENNINASGISTFLNPYSYLMLRNHKDLLGRFDNIYVDGQWLCHFLKMFGVSSVQRCSFDNSSAAPVVFEHAQKKGKSVAIVGSDTRSVTQFDQYLRKTYPKLDVVLVRNGYFDSDLDRVEVLKSVVDSGADIVIAGMGAINQEQFLSELKSKGWSGAGYTCGGFIHQTAKKGHGYYPQWVNRYNLRFLYRIFDEPKLVKRYTIDYAKFVFVYTYDVIKYKSK